MTKICPLITNPIGGFPRDCSEDDCEWWIPLRGCAVKMLAIYHIPTTHTEMEQGIDDALAKIERISSKHNGKK